MNQISFQATLQTSVSPAFNIGQRAMTPDGREWVYIKAAEALSKGAAVVPDGVTAVDQVSSSTDALGRIVYITKSGASWTTNQFAEGWVVVDDGTGVGQAGKIVTNNATTLQLYPEFAFTTALSASDSDITIRTPYFVDESAVTSKIQSCQGIVQTAFAASEFGWAQTYGPGVVLAGEALAVGGGFNTGDDTAGQVVKNIATESVITAQPLGYCLVANAAADQLALVFININA